MKTAFLTIVTMILFACARDQPKQYDRAGVDRRYQAVYDLTKDLSCADATVCSSIGIGAKPCGGPWLNLVYSTATVSADALTAAVDDLNAYEAGYNREQGGASDCSMAPPANPGCVNNQCVDITPSP